MSLVLLGQAIKIGAKRLMREALLPVPRRQRGDVAGRMLTDSLQHVDQISVGVDAVKPAICGSETAWTVRGRSR